MQLAVLCLFFVVLAASNPNADAEELSLVQLRAETFRAHSSSEMRYDFEDDDWVPGPLFSKPQSPPSSSVVRMDDDTTDTNDQDFPTDDLSAFGSVKSRKSGSVIVGFGFQKCATTFVSAVLRDPQHNVNPQNKKELHYIARRDPSQEHHAEATEVKPSHCAKTSKGNGEVTMESYITDCFGRYPKPNEVTFDFTPDYAAPENVEDFVKAASAMIQPARQHNAEMRFLAMLRNPVDRAISELDMKRKHGSMTATDAEMDQMMLNHVTMASQRWSASQLSTKPWAGWPPLMTFGEYNQSLAPILQELPKESVLVVNTAQLSEPKVWNRIYAHIGLDMPGNERFTRIYNRQSQAGLKNSEQKYTSSNTKKWVPSQNVNEALEEYYKPFNQQLWKLLGVKWW